MHLAQVSRHLSQFADDGSFGYGYSRYGRETRRHEIEIGETYEDDLIGTQWTNIGGTKQSWGTIAFDLSAIVSSTPIDDWKPTSEEFEGYTGNAGNTLDRWYHRSALVVWHRDHHFEIVASCGAAESIPLFRSMAAWLTSVGLRLESATAQKPQPPADWTRPANVDCKCEYCTQLKAFLADPANKIGRIPAREDRRQHVSGIIERHQCDVTDALERKGSPYSQLLTKTTGSFDRALKRFEADCRLLSELPDAS